MKKLLGKCVLIIGGCGVASVDKVILANNEFEKTMQEINDSIVILSQVSGRTVEQFNNDLNHLYDNGLSLSEIKAIIKRMEAEQRMLQTEERIVEMTLTMPDLKQPFIHVDPSKSQEEIYRDKYFAKSTWNQQKRSWPKHGTGRIRTKNKRNDPRKINK